jgi:hypothetical protein
MRLVNFGNVHEVDLDPCIHYDLTDNPHIEPNVDPITGAIFYGKNRWAPITVIFKTKAYNDSVTRLVGHQLMKQMMHFEADTFSTSSDYKFTLETDQFLLEGCWITNVEYSELTELTIDTTITALIRFDNATFKTSG